MKRANVPSSEQVTKFIHCCNLVGKDKHLMAPCRQPWQVLDQPAHLGLFLRKNEGFLVNLLVCYDIFTIVGWFPNRNSDCILIHNISCQLLNGLWKSG